MEKAALEFISTHYELAKRVEQIFQCSALCSSQMCKKYLLEYTVQYCGSKFPGTYFKGEGLWEKIV